MFRLSLRLVFAPVLILQMFFSPAVLRAQQSSAEIPSITIRANTKLVLVDVVVTDKKGQPVAGLKADDFSVEENGKKQKISVFMPPSGMTRTAQAPAPNGILSNHTENVGPAGAPIVLLLDAVNSPFKEQAYARSQMLKYVTEQAQYGSPMAVVTLTDRLHVLQQFTSDPQILLTAIKNFRPQEQILKTGGEPIQSSSLQDTTLRPAASQFLDAAQVEVVAFAGAQVGYDLERRTLITVDAMRSLVRMLGGLQGRKNVVWLTAELPFDLIPEDRNVSDAELLADLPNRAMQSKSLGLRASGAVAGEERRLHGEEIRAAEAQLATANISIYPVDLHGLLGGMASASVSGSHDFDIHGEGLARRAITESSNLRVSQATLEEVAAETGGKAYMNQNEIKQGIALAAADDKASYEIGYYPENKKWDGKYRNIKVKLAQGDTQVRYRKGYYAMDPTQAKNPNYEQDVATALLFNAPATQISFMAQAKPTDPGKVRVVFLVDAHTVSAEDAGKDKRINMALYATILDSNGKSVQTRSLKVDRAFDAATYQQILDKGMMVPIDMDMPAGSKQLRLAVLDNKTGFIGTVGGPIGQ